MTIQGTFSVSTMLLLALLFASCSTVPLTGRQQLNLIPSSQMLSMSTHPSDQTRIDQIRQEIPEAQRYY